MSLQCRHLRLSIADKVICKDLKISFNPGEFWGIMGINGVGKTTLLKSLIGLHEVDTENDKNMCIQLNNQSIYSYKRLELAQKTGIMLQEYEYNFPSTVLEATLIGRHPFLNQWQIEDTHDEQLALQALKRAGLEKLSQRALSTLSGGEKRRVNLATLLTQNPDYYLLDEPVNHLDLKAQMDILTLLSNQFKNSGQCGIMVIHDPNLAWRFCDHILLLFNKGEWLAGDTQQILTKDNLSRLYDCKIQQAGNGKNDTFFSPVLESEGIGVK
ncbi:MAG: ABC transporter ATP-binding protein [gamma proteobacterium symbiont of Taylorina sp.]|nr:ABC transporter ATP-binding protein [gamma proteobacterium symbiont of Taylorina sp.]